MTFPSIPEYIDSIRIPALVCAPMLAHGRHEEINHQVIKYSGGFCVVFPYITPSKKYAVRCWHVKVDNAQKRIKAISDALRKSNLPYFVGFDYVPEGIITSHGRRPIVVMDWVEAKTIKQYIGEHIDNASGELNRLADDFLRMVKDLHTVGFSHGDLQHGNILVKEDGSLILVDYDSMYVPELAGEDDNIKGLQGYQCYARWTNKYLSPKSDYFSELVIYITIKALIYDKSYWRRLNMTNTETMLFSVEDIQSKGTTHIFRELKCIDALSGLVDKLCMFMSCKTLDELQPLEEAVLRLSDKIGDKWKGHVPEARPAIKMNIDDISAKWKR